MNRILNQPARRLSNTLVGWALTLLAACGGGSEPVAPIHQWQESSSAGARSSNIERASSVSNSAGGADDSAATLTTVNVARFRAITPTMTIVRAFHAAALLPDGQVLITGGTASAVSGTSSLNTAELYDPTANTFTALPATMQQVRDNHTATTLKNGQVLLTGGQDNINGDGHNTAELYDPVTKTFTAIAATMTTPRGGHSHSITHNSPRRPSHA